MLSRIVVLVVLAGLVFAGESAGQTAPNQPGGLARISHRGSGSVTISWDASCPPYAGDSDPQSWSWYITINGTYPDGRDAFDSGSIGPAIGSTSWTGHQTFAVSPEDGHRSDRITWTLQLHCGSAEPPVKTLGSGVFTVGNSGGGGSGSGSGGSGSGGSGSGSGGSGSGSSGSGSGGSGSGRSGSGSGGSHCVVPKLAGKTLTVTRRLLKHAHCTLGTVTRPTVPSGVSLLVRSSTPRAGAHLRNGAKVDVKLRKA